MVKEKKKRDGKMKILTVDDSAFMRKLISNILTRQGYNDILFAGNGREALAVYELEKPDLVILDIIMPGMDGLTTIKALRKMDKKAKVVMVTAVGQEEIMDECKKMGAMGYITKPFDDKEIAALLEKILGPGRKNAKKGKKQSRGEF